jgi:hypothetical protein
MAPLDAPVPNPPDDPAMPMYIFYPCLADGSATSFEAYELEDDTVAAEQGAAVLAAHASATHVTVWRDGEALGPIPRDAAAGRPGLAEPPV